MHCTTGNLACDAVGGGRIIFYDFGMMDELSMPLKRGLVNLIFGIYGNDVTEVVDSLEEMDVIRKVSTHERLGRFFVFRLLGLECAYSGVLSEVSPRQRDLPFLSSLDARDCLMFLLVKLCGIVC